MFTGIIETLGIVQKIDSQKDILLLGIRADFSGTVKTGDSISVNGVCLTVARIDKKTFYFDAAAETLKITDIGNLKLNDKVNLETALKAGDKIGGHFVTGHIDTVGVIRKKIILNRQAVFEIGAEGDFINEIVQKGSVAIDGISLTIVTAGRDYFTVNVIPHTLQETTLGFKKSGDKVNIEFDVMGKYARRTKNRITEDFLKEHGFF